MAPFFWIHTPPCHIEHACKPWSYAGIKTLTDRLSSLELLASLAKDIAHIWFNWFKIHSDHKSEPTGDYFWDNQIHQTALIIIFIDEREKSDLFRRKMIKDERD